MSDAKQGEPAPIIARKSNRNGHVAISVQLRCGGWETDRAKIDASTEITSDQARALARSLIEIADHADAKTAAKVASEDRRRKWRDREVAAGRMVVIGGLGR